MKKKIFCILLFIILITTFTYSFAAGDDFSALFKSGEKVLTPDSNTNVNNILSMIIRLIQYVGSGIALLVITIYGIKYMLASPAEKADVKKQIEPILIGCILLFGTVNIVGLIAKLAEGALKN